MRHFLLLPVAFFEPGWMRRAEPASADDDDHLHPRNDNHDHVRDPGAGRALYGAYQHQHLICNSDACLYGALRHHHLCDAGAGLYGTRHHDHSGPHAIANPPSARAMQTAIGPAAHRGQPLIGA